MKRSVYVALFVVVLLLACLGGLLGGRALLNRFQQDFGPQAGWTPLATGGDEAATGVTPTAMAVASPVPTARRATATVLVVPAPVTDQPPLLANTPEPTWTAGVLIPTAIGATIEGLVTSTGTPEPSVTPVPAFPFVLARSVRYSSGDCPGTYALGAVTDRAGNPLAGIRISLVDEYGNAATAVTKPGPGDTGRYDFPMTGPPRRFYMTVVDDAGRALSQRIEILHDLPPQQGNGCRWIDWRRN